MTELADYQIIETTRIAVGDTGEQPFKRTFTTGGRKSAKSFLLFMVERDELVSGADVFLNGTKIGSIASRTGIQTIIFNGGILKDTPNKNEVEISAPRRENPQQNDIFEDFFIDNLVCFFKQDS